MKLFRNSNDPDYPGEKQVNLKDVLLAVWLFFFIVSALVAVYSLIWSAWPLFRVACTSLVTTILFMSLTIEVFPEDK